VLNSSPAQVEIFTSQEMRRQGTANSITVEDERGNRVNDGDASIDDANRRRISVALRPNLPNGRYVVRFQTLSDEDGESDSGAFAFYVGTQPSDAQKAQDAQLRLTESEVAAPGEGVGSAIPVIGALVAVLAVIVLAGSGWILLRSRSRPS
jgi:methionine-rich copper-binding protein CopC